jgi:hypothetical protein
MFWFDPGQLSGAKYALVQRFTGIKPLLFVPKYFSDQIKSGNWQRSGDFAGPNVERSSG